MKEKYEKKKYITGLIIAASIIAGVLILDLVTKAVVDTDGFYHVVIPNFLVFNYTKNYFAAFSSTFGMDPDVFRVVVIILTFIAIGGILFFLIWKKKKHTLLTIALALIAAGAAGNLVDRLMFGYVRDFIMIVYFGLTIFGSTNFAIFNIADMSLICGVIVMLVWVIFFFIREGNNNDKASPMNPVLVTEGGAPEKKEFEPILPRPEPDEDEEEAENEADGE